MTDEHYGELSQLGEYAVIALYRDSGHPQAVGGRNIHAMSGRAA